MGTLRTQMENYMKTNGYSDKSIKLYTTCVKNFAYHYMKSPLVITQKQIEDFFLFLRLQNKSQSTIHIYYEALKFFYSMVNMKTHLPKIRIGRITNKIPYIPSQEELFSIISNCSSLKFRTIFMLIYSAGLRVSEAANIRLSDIDFSRKTILIRNGKNNKTRYTILADATISMITDYLKIYKPVDYLFYKKRDITEQISISHIQRTFSNLIKKSNCKQEIHVHTLRHCFATHLLENGTSIFYIMKLLGHANIQTTMVYLHMQDLSKLNLESPIDHNRAYSTICSYAQTQSMFLQSA